MLNPDYAYAHYQRACANATLDQLDTAMNDLKQAVSLSATYLEEAQTDNSLINLRQSGRLDELLTPDAIES